METDIDYKARGFVEMPGYSRYLINRDGVVINRRTGKRVRVTIDCYGYPTTSLKRDSGIFNKVGLHRALGLAFLHPGEDVSKLVINHLDGVKTNNSLSNLEWCTPGHNTLHAIETGLIVLNKPVEVRNAETGAVKYYNSAKECAKERGLMRDCLLRRLKFPDSRVWGDRCQYRWAAKDKEWIIPDDVDLEVLKNGTRKSIAVKHLLENKTYIFGSLSEAANHLNIALPTLSMWLDLPNQPVFPGYVQVKLLTDTTPWREVKDPYLDFTQNSMYKVVKTIDLDGNVKIYNSARECADDNGLLVTTLNERLNSKGTKVYKDGKRYYRYQDSV